MLLTRIDFEKTIKKIIVGKSQQGFAILNKDLQSQQGFVLKFVSLHLFSHDFIERMLCIEVDVVFAHVGVPNA